MAKQGDSLCPGKRLHFDARAGTGIGNDGFPDRREGERQLEDLLHECMNKTGYDRATVENVLNIFLKILRDEPDFSVKIDFGEYAGESVLMQRNKKDFGGGLLETLSMKAGCRYLSDLRYPEQLVFVKHALYKIEPDRYSIREWTDAVNYITGQSLCFKDRTEAVEYLKTYTSQPGSRGKKGGDQRQ